MYKHSKGLKIAIGSYDSTSKGLQKMSDLSAICLLPAEQFTGGSDICLKVTPAILLFSSKLIPTSLPIGSRVTSTALPPLLGSF